MLASNLVGDWRNKRDLQLNTFYGALFVLNSYKFVLYFTIGLMFYLLLAIKQVQAADVALAQNQHDSIHQAIHIFHYLLSTSSVHLGGPTPE